jgi:hypothetical protein
MDSNPEQLEALWNDLLSLQVELVREAFNSLDPTSQKTVLLHLKRMVSESGWQPEQRTSAKAALRALENQLIQDELWKSAN